MLFVDVDYSTTLTPYRSGDKKDAREAYEFMATLQLEDATDDGTVIAFAGSRMVNKVGFYTGNVKDLNVFTKLSDLNFVEVRALSLSVSPTSTVVVFDALWQGAAPTGTTAIVLFADTANENPEIRHIIISPIIGLVSGTQYRCRLYVASTRYGRI